ncbi:MAG TPA: ABC transporter permease [Solirubrobacteraceae bacterium]|nr:ABC transporter permease [Solirubrobacteraceae bacterium]
MATEISPPDTGGEVQLAPGEVASTAGVHPIAGVRVPTRSLAGELRAIRVVWRRELIRFSRDRLRIVTSLVQPFLFLFVLGTGLSSLVSVGIHGVNFKTFIYPGVLCMAVMFTAMFSAASIVWDREFGFLREMMVAPVRRSSIVLGKCLGGATVAAFQGVIVIAIAGLVEVPYELGLMLELFALTLLLAFAITAFGMMAAARITQMQSFMALMQMAIMPMFFISGAMFSVASLPGWLAVLNRIDPLTYAVDPMRRAIFAHLNVPSATRHALAPGVSWWGWHVPSLLEAGVIAALGLVMLGVAIWEFSRVE